MEPAGDRSGHARKSAMGRRRRVRALARPWTWAAGLCGILLLPVGLAGAQELSPPDDLELVAHPLEAAPILDGSLEEWSAVPARATARLERAEQCHPAPERRVWQGPEDASASVQVAVHDRDLYLGVRFVDDRSFHDPDRPWWHGDSLEVFVDADRVPGEAPAAAYTPGCWQIFVMPQNPELPWGVVFRGRRTWFDDGGLSGVRVAARRDEAGGWTAEMRIPLANFGRAEGPRNPLGFALALNDADAGPEDPGTYLSWNRGFDLYRFPRNFGRLALPPGPAPRPAPGAATPSWTWILPIGALLLLGLALLAPLARALGRIRARPKVVLLGLVGLLALGIHLHERATQEDARARAAGELAALAAEAEPLLAAAREAGALYEADAAARGRALADLLAGESIPARPGVEAAAFVALGPGGAFAAGTRGDANLSLEEPLDLPLPEPVEAERLRVLTVPALGTRTRLEPGALGTLDVHCVGAESVRVALPQASGADREAVGLGGRRRVRALRWTPGEAAARTRLAAVEALAGDGAPAGRPLLLCARTEEGVPVLAHPGRPFAGVRVEAGAERRFDLPQVAGGADRLWLLLSPERAFPEVLGDQVLVGLEVHYDRGPPDAVALSNGEHFAQERLPVGLDRPASLRSRVAWRVPDTLGTVHHQTAIVVPLDEARLPRALVVQSRGPGGAVALYAATLVRTRRPGPASPVQLLLDPARPADRVHALGVADRFADRVSGRTRPAGPSTVVHRAELGEPAAPVPLALRTRLPAAVGEARERATVALLACLGLGLFLAVLLAVDLAERARSLGRRLGLGALAAALVPLGATLFLVDQQARERIQAEQEGVASGGLQAVSERLEAVLAEAEEVARRVARHLAGDAQGPGVDLNQVLELHGAGALGAQAALSARVSGARFPPVLLAAGAQGGLSAPRFLGSAEAQRGLRVSPWDGLVAVGAARAGRAEDWVRVVIGVRLDGGFLGRALGEVRGGCRRSVAVLDSGGGLLAGAGGDPEGLGRDAARHVGLLASDGWTDASNLQRPRVLQGAAHILAARAVGGAEGLVAVGVDRQAIHAEMVAQRAPLWWIGAFGLLLVLVATTLVARRVAAPVEELAHTAEGLRLGRFDLPLPPSSGDEVGRLTVAFEQMRRDLKSRIEDLDFLRSMQEELSGSLEFGSRARAAARRFHVASGAAAVHLLEVGGPDAPVSLAASQGGGRDLGHRPFLAASGGWIRAATQALEPLELDLAAPDPRLAAETGAGRALLEGKAAAIVLPLRAMRDLQGLVVLTYDDRAAFARPEGRRLLGAMANATASALNNANLYRLAALDEVTRLPGATAFEAALRADVEKAVAGGPPVALLRVGVDHLEPLARRRGVERARQLLRAHAQALRALLGERRRLGRLNDDELAVRLPGASEEEVRELAERIRRRLGRVELSPDEGGETLASTVSVGVARCPGDARSPEFLLDAAARARAAAQREGGDRVEDVQRLRSGAVDAPPFEEGAVFRSTVMVEVVEAARRAARTDASVLITGETGTGKEVVATLIHRRSARATRPFVSVNCAAFPETLLESELFGHEKGAFTGAERRREGRFELADGGTLFLDEIAEMSPGAQAKLLRVLQERQFTRLGGTRAITTDVRIVAATNRNLEEAVERKTFREDLYYRLNVVRLEVPPLRERREEIPLLVEHFLGDLRRRHGRAPSGFAPAAMDLLYRYPWPGNVRELKNVVERCAVLCPRDVVEAADVHLEGTGGDRHAALLPRGAPGDDLNPRQRALLEHLARHGRCTNREYQELSGTSPRTGLRDLQDLIDRNLVVREGRRRGAVYRLRD